MRKNNKLMRFIALFFFVNTVIFWFVGFSYLNTILSSTTLFKNSVIDLSFFWGKFFIIVFAIVNYLSFMMLLGFVPAVVVSLFAWAIPSKRIIVLLSVFFATLGVILLIIDSYIYSMFKFHLNTTLVSFIISPHSQEIFDFSQNDLIAMGAVVLATLVIELGIAWVIWKKINLDERIKSATMIAVLGGGGLLFSYLTLLLSMAQGINLLAQQTHNLPMFSQLFEFITPNRNAENDLFRFSETSFYQPIFSNDKLHYPRHPMRCKAPDKPYNIILIMVDSLRFDSVQQMYMPKLTQFSKKNWRFQQHLSGGNATQPGLFSLFYSIPSSYWTAALKQSKKPVFMATLAKYGYSSHVFWSSEMELPPFDKTIYTGIVNLASKGAPGHEHGNRDRFITNKAIALLEADQTKAPFFLNLFYDAPHVLCGNQNFSKPFQPAAQSCPYLFKQDTDPLPHYNHYLNAAKFIDDEIDKLLRVIERKGYLNNSIVIVTSDHGQEFNDNQQNYWGHAGNFTNIQVHVPLIIHWPSEAPQKIDYLTSGYDVMPTLLTRLFSCENPISDYSVGQNLFSKQGRLPFILAGSYVNMGLIEPDRLTILEASGRINMMNIQAGPLTEGKPRKKMIRQALELMRRYF